VVKVTYTIEPRPGLVLCVRTAGFGGEMIRFGAALIGASDLENHILVLDHKTGDTWWGVEGRPGGVGWVDATAYLESPWTLSNQGQEVTLSKANSICRKMRGLLGTPYDWRAIGEDALRDLHLSTMWAEKWHGVAPAHVVCSSVAAYAYSVAELAYPKQTDLPHIQPADWADFIILNGFQSSPPLVKAPVTPPS